MSGQDVELLLFEVGGTLYGTDATSVLRIDRPTASAGEVAELGALRDGGRALVFKGPEGEAQLRVDLVRGVVRAQMQNLRRMPAAGRGAPCAVGLWLSEERPVLLLDLIKTLKASTVEAS